MESIEDQHQNSISISQLQLQSQQQSEVQKQREKLGFQADLDPTDSDTASGVNHELTEKIINQELQKLYINDEDHQHAVASVEQKETSENFGFQNAMSSVHFDDDGVNRELTEKIINFHKVEINDEGLRFPEASPEREEFSEIKLQNFSSNVDVVGKEQDRKSKLKDDEEESRNDLESADLEANEVKEEGLDQVEAAKDESGADHDSDERSESENGSENENEKEREEGVGEYENVNEESESGTGPVSVFKDGTYRRYPIRPDAEDCPYYMKTGTCKFGSHCKFNHPPRKKNQFPKEKLKQKEDNPERPGQVECKYYLTSGGCKYGRACKFNHSRAMTPVAAILELNFLGLPIRLGEKECPYFMRTGSCKYGSNCRFNHPDPTAAGGSDPPSGLGNSAQGASHSSMSSLSPPGHLSESSPFVPVMFPSTQRLPSPNPGMNGYQVPVYPTSERSLPTPPAFAMTNPATETKFYPLHQQQVPVDEFPERPGQPECSYYMKTGDCKYGSGCKFHHPKSRVPKTAPYFLSDRGLPLRPGQNICTHYSRYGICKFGPACRYNHPENYGDSDSSVGSGADQPPHFSNSASADVPRMAGSGHGRKPLVQQHV